MTELNGHHTLTQWEALANMWGETDGPRLADEALVALESAGYAVVPLALSNRMMAALLTDWDKRGRNGQGYRDIWNTALTASRLEQVKRQA